MRRGAERAWFDADLWIEISEGKLKDAAAVLAGHGFEEFELLTTSRARTVAPPELIEAATTVHEIPAGPVPDLAATLLEAVGPDPRLVALGGGRVADTAKAVAAVKGGAVAAVPTTLSGAELTSLHRLPAGSGPAPQLRASVVLIDPLLLGSIPEPALRSSAGNALAHGIDALIGSRADAETVRRALSGSGLIAGALDQAPEDRDLTDLALGSALCALALERGGLSIHHVLAQTVVRLFKTPHAETHSSVLAASVTAIAGRNPEAAAGLAAVLGTSPPRLSQRIQELAGAYALGDLGADGERIDEVVELALGRLAGVPGGTPDAGELLSVLEAAF